MIQPTFPLAVLLAVGTASPVLGQEVGGSWMDLHQLQYLHHMVGPNSIPHAPFDDWDQDGHPDMLRIGTGRMPSGRTAVFLQVLSGKTAEILHRTVVPGWHLSTATSRSLAVLERLGDLNHDGVPDYGMGLRHGVRSDLIIYSGADLTELGYPTAGAPTTSQHDWIPLPYRILSAGDVDGDGIPDFRVIDGASPQVRLISGNTFSPIRSTRLSASGATGFPMGDLNADGFPDFALLSQPGEYQMFSGMDDQGLYSVAFRYHTKYLMGVAPTSLGDINGDQHVDFCVLDKDGGLAIDMYSGSNGSQVGRYPIPISGGSYNMGDAIAALGDLNGDGITEIAIGFGSHHASEPMFMIFDPVTHAFTDGPQVEEDEYGAFQGHADYIQVIGDLTSDGRPDLLVSSRHETRIFAWSDILDLDRSEISASTGGIVQGQLWFPPSAAGMNYRTLISFTGTGPISHGTAIPLTKDALLIRTAGGIYPGQAEFTQGTLNLNGEGAFSFTFAPGELSSAIGRTFYLAAVASQPGQLPSHSSVPRAVSISP